MPDRKPPHGANTTAHPRYQFTPHRLYFAAAWYAGVGLYRYATDDLGGAATFADIVLALGAGLFCVAYSFRRVRGDE